MISNVILLCMASLQTMPRKTIYIPESTTELVEEHAREGESFSATVVRLIELGAREGEHEVPLDYIGSGEGPGDLGINAEKYLGLKPWGPGEGPSD
jgi:predicted CopG family antitoxin